MKRLNVIQAVDDELASSALRSDGPLVDVELRFENEEGELLPPVYGKALIDTGADRTAIEFASAEVAGAAPVGSLNAQGATSEATTLPMYAVTVGFPGTNTSVNVIGAGTPHLTSQGIVALIGRDVLSQSHLTYDGPRGEFALRSPEGHVAVKSSKAALGSIVLAGLLGACFAYGMFSYQCQTTT